MTEACLQDFFSQVYNITLTLEKIILIFNIERKCHKREWNSASFAKGDKYGSAATDDGV